MVFFYWYVALCSDVCQDRAEQLERSRNTSEQNATYW